MTIISASENDAALIRDLAIATWPDTFIDIISRKQIDYMLELLYSVDSLNEQMKNGHHFILAKDDNEVVGFASYELNYKNEPKTKLHKIYILPFVQNEGVGTALINFIKQEAHKHNNPTLTLNVNRRNKAVLYYKKQDFEIVKEEDIDIGSGFLMEDFVMEKSLV